jgi:hypothetical protein
MLQVQFFTNFLLLKQFTYFWAEVEPSPLLLRQFFGLLYQPRLIDRDEFGAFSGMNDWQGKLKYLEETCLSAALFTMDATKFDPGSNLGLHCLKPATNSLRYGTAMFSI